MAAKMSTAVKNFITYGHPEDERISINAQIEAAEAEGKSSYTITIPSGYYKIKNGQVVGAGKWI